MCDCYSEPCKICGKFIEIHLGDYDTARSEIVIYCKDCSLSSIFGLQRINLDRSLVWKTKEYGIILIAYLTDNAWNKRNGNSPNTGDAKQDSMVKFLQRREKKEIEESIKWKEWLEKLNKNNIEKVKGK
jgi:hypothetical protein